MLRNLFIKQHPAIATRTQRTVSGQASFAGRAVRKAHSESQADRPENEFIHFPAGFLAFPCPETRLACFKLQAQFVCSSCLQPSPEWVQGAKSPGAGFQGPHRPLTFFLLEELEEKSYQPPGFFARYSTNVSRNSMRFPAFSTALRRPSKNLLLSGSGITMWSQWVPQKPTYSSAVNTRRP